MSADSIVLGSCDSLFDCLWKCLYVTSLFALLYLEKAKWWETNFDTWYFIVYLSYVTSVLLYFFVSVLNP